MSRGRLHAISGWRPDQPDPVNAALGTIDTRSLCTVVAEAVQAGTHFSHIEQGILSLRFVAENHREAISCGLYGHPAVEEQ